jgi:hypothetical protein
MTSCNELLTSLRELDAVLTYANGKIAVSAPQPIPPAVFDALRLHSVALKAALATLEGDIEYPQLAAALAVATLPPIPPLTDREARAMGRPTARQRVAPGLAPLDVAAPQGVAPQGVALEVSPLEVAAREALHALGAIVVPHDRLGVWITNHPTLTPDYYPSAVDAVQRNEVAA